MQRFLTHALMVLLTVAPAMARNGVKATIGDPATSKSSVEMTPLFSHLPRMGFVPVTVVVRNETSENLGFRLETSSKVSGGSRTESSMDAVISLSAPKTQTTLRSVLVPLVAVPKAPGSYSSGRDNRLEVRLTGPVQASFNQYEALDSEQPACAFSIGLSRGTIDPFNTERAATLGGGRYGNTGSYASEFDPAGLPEDWRALSGFVSASFTTEEWMKLAPAVRAGVLQWVQLGGTLSLYTQTKETFEQLQIPLPAGADRPFAAGHVRVFDWTGVKPDKVHLDKEYSLKTLVDTSTRFEVKSNYLGALQKLFGERSFAAWQVGIILVLFGILVGPVNLFYFAKAGRRHRLFFTTPIISVVASLVLIATIMLQDGSGGAGVRVSVISLNPATATEAIWQDQISRTGVLFASNYQISEPAIVTPVLLPDSQWTRLKALDYNSPGQRYSQPDFGSYAGDWFQSRSEQAQNIQSVKSTRGRLELVSASPPTIRSSLAYPLEVLFYKDEKEQLWCSAEPLTTGGSAVLQPCTIVELAKGAENFGFKNHTTMDPVQEALSGHFYAFTSSPNADFIPTLESIKWEHSSALVYGPVVSALTP